MFLLAAILVLLYVAPFPNEWAAPLIALAVLVEIGWVWYWIRWTKRGKAKVGTEAMVGEQGEVVEPGWVRVHGELWKARGTGRFDPGQSVRVKGVDGLTLIVE